MLPGMICVMVTPSTSAARNTETCRARKPETLYGVPPAVTVNAPFCTAVVTVKSGTVPRV